MLESITVITLLLSALERIDLQAIFDHDDYESRRSALPGQFLGPHLLVVAVVAGQRGEKGHQIVDITLAQGEGLYILVEVNHFRHELDADRPLREVAFRDGGEEIALRVIGVLAPHLIGLLAREVLDALRLPPIRPPHLPVHLRIVRHLRSL
jgi:hypothetical protein